MSSTPLFKTTLMITALLAISPVNATTISIVNNDNAGEGFNDPTTVPAVAGNPAVTIGQQRLNVFYAAAEFWEERIDSDVEIKIDSAFDPLTCSPNSAVLGQAGSRGYIHRDFANAPKPSTWYPQALANSLKGFDADTDNNDIGATFNSAIDGNNNCLSGTNWWYGIGAAAPANTIDLYGTVIHEIAHGLGFSSFTSPANGSMVQGLPNTYSDNLRNVQTNKDWRNMTDAERITSGTSTGNIVWTGAKATEESDFLVTGKNGNYIRMYAPNPYQGGSSISHWDTLLGPNEIMEPALTPVKEPWLSIKAMYDMGWQGHPCPAIEMPHNIWTLAAISCELPTNENTVDDVFGSKLPGVAGTDWAVYEYNEITSAYVPLAATDVLEQGEAYWIIQASGAALSVDISRDSHRPDRTTSAACSSSNGCYSIPLTVVAGQNTTNTIGNTFPWEFKWSDVRFKTSSGVCQNGCTPDTALSNNIASNVGFIYNPVSGSYVAITSNSSVEVSQGVWIQLKASSFGLNPELLIPASTL